MKLAVLYAGQGAQHPGMGKEFYEASPAFRAAFDSAALDFDLHRVCFEDPDGVLNQTEYTQPCMVAFACGVTAVLAEKGVKPAYLAGLSLGEYSALQAAGVFTAKQAIELTAFRGKAMAEAAKGLDCGMTAVLGLDREKLSACCEQAAEAGCVQICNYNCPGQLVIGGEKAAVEQAAALAKEAGARRCIPLKVSGPFHTKLMAPAGDALAQRFAGESFGTMETPVLFNCLGHEKAETDSIPQLLVKQVQSSVYMEDTPAPSGRAGADHTLGRPLAASERLCEKDPARGGLHRSGDPGTAGCGADRMEGSRMSEEKLTRAAIVTGGSRGIGRAVRGTGKAGLQCGGELLPRRRACGADGSALPRRGRAGGDRAGGCIHRRGLQGTVRCRRRDFWPGGCAGEQRGHHPGQPDFAPDRAGF